jgi:hypothetical protein
MVALYIVLWALAVVCFGLAVFGRTSRVNLIALGLCFGALVFLIQTIDSVV